MMPTVRTTLSDADYRHLVAMRKKEGLPSVSALFLKSTIGLTPEIEADEIVKQAMKLAAKKSKGDEFRLRDLFSQQRWEGFNKSARLKAGRAFHAKVAAARDGIRIGKKTASNHQLYIKS